MLILIFYSRMTVITLKYDFNHESLTCLPLYAALKSKNSANTL